MITDTKTASLEPLLLLEALHPGFEKGRGFMICAFPRDDRSVPASALLAPGGRCERGR